MKHVTVDQTMGEQVAVGRAKGEHPRPGALPLCAAQREGCSSAKVMFRSQHQSGTAMSEYLISTVAVAFALFVPIPGLDESAFVFFVEALKGFQANTTYQLSLP